jgi:hypothetical protein
MASQSGISVDTELPLKLLILACIGHRTVNPLAASPLMGSMTHSNKTKNARRILTLKV